MPSRKFKPSTDTDDFDDFDDALDHSQFPSGGSRVVGSRSADDLDVTEESSTRTGDFNFSKQPEQQGFDLDHSIFASRDDEFSDLAPPVVEPEVVKQTSSDAPQDVLVIHLMANKGETLKGEDLLAVSVEVGLRYGAMKIFHRHISDDGSGPVLFSMANLVNPGTFDLNTMPKITTPGVILFMALDDLDDPSGAFEIMIEAINKMAEKLPLNVMDESRSSMTLQTIDHYRQRAKKANLQQSNDHE